MLTYDVYRSRTGFATHVIVIDDDGKWLACQTIGPNKETPVPEGWYAVGKDEPVTCGRCARNPIYRAEKMARLRQQAHEELIRRGYRIDTDTMDTRPGPVSS